MSTFHELFEHYVKNPDAVIGDAKDAIKINPQDVMRDMLFHTEQYLHWAHLASLADADARRKKREIQEILLPEARENARVDLETSGSKATIAAVNDIALSNKKYREAAARLDDAEELSSLLKKVELAMFQRRDMLQSFNSRQKLELSTMPLASEDTHHLTQQYSKEQ